MVYQSEKLIQIENPVSPAIGLSTDAGRRALADQLNEDIDEYSRKAYNDGKRKHLGASEIGHNCARYLWYKFRWCFEEEFNGRMYRLFNRGHREEERFIEWLRGTGAQVIQTGGDGKQLRMSAIGDHFGGSCDGQLILARYGLTEPLLVEMKTHSAKSFAKLVEQGVKLAKPRHFSQMCVYGVGFGVHYAVYMAICKDTDELWIEVLELSHEAGSALYTKAHTIITSVEAPPKVSNNPSFFECKWCAAHRICHMGEAPDRNCRSCKFATPDVGGTWKCSNFGIIPEDFIQTGCDRWEGIA